MSKIYEALENAEKERIEALSKNPLPAEPGPTAIQTAKEVRKTAPAMGPTSTPPPVAPKEEKKAVPAQGPKGAWTERTVFPPTLKSKEEKKTGPLQKSKPQRLEAPNPRRSPEVSSVGTFWKWFRTKKAAPAGVLEPREAKKTAPVTGPISTPAPMAPKEEKKAVPAQEPTGSWMERTVSPPLLKSKEEKTAPVPESKQKRIEKIDPPLAPELSPFETLWEWFRNKRPASARAPEPISTPPPVAPKEEKKAAIVPEPKQERMERTVLSSAPKPIFTSPPVVPKDEKKAVPAQESKGAGMVAPKEEKKAAIVPELKQGRIERVVLSSTPEAIFTSPPVASKDEKKTVPAQESKGAGMVAPKEEKKAAIVPEPKQERIERRQVVLPPKKAIKTVRSEMERDYPLVSLFQPGSLGAEQFRKLRNQILKLNTPDPPKTIMVTSATEGEGKTFVAANLAAGIAHDLHFHALLVDCDLRSPSLSSWFGVQNGHGLSDYLVGGGDLSEFLLKTRMDKLMILTGGSSQDKPAELVGSKKMEALVRELKCRYDDRYIIFDATPVLATTEPEILARWVDGILFVVRAGVTSRETVKQAVASLDPNKILGFVLNDVEFKSSGLSSRYFGSGRYYSKYGYGYGKKGAEPQSLSGEVTPLKKRSD
jgi:protein-tyrosine kinase